MASTQKARRTYGTGGLTHLGKDRWRVTINLGQDPLTGRRRRHTEVVRAPNKTAAQKHLDGLRHRLDGQRVGHGKTTLRTLFAEYLVACQTEGGMSDFNANQAQAQFDRYCPESLQATPIDAVDAHTVGRLYNSLLTDGWSRALPDGAPAYLKAEGGPVKAKTVHRFHANLSAAFGYAMQLGWLADNPAARRRRWNIEEKETKPPTAKQLIAFLDHIDKLAPDPGKGTSPLPDYVPLLVDTGARPGEPCALRWSDYNPETGRLTIDENRSRSKTTTTKATKTGKVRHVTLSADTRALLERRRRRFQPVAFEAGIAMDDWWVFPMASQPMKPARPDTIGMWFRRAREAVGAPDTLTPLSLRHFVGSVLVGSGVDVRTAAGRLGHDAEMLLGRYAHLLDAQEAEAAEVVSRVLKDERKRSR